MSKGHEPFGFCFAFLDPENLVLFAFKVQDLLRGELE